MKDPTTVPLPQHLVPLVSVLADETGLPPEMFRLILLNVFRNGYVVGSNDALEEALNSAAEEIGKRATGGLS